ncbi:MAG: glycosyltransferase family 2 protein, partial [bacterium]
MNMVDKESENRYPISVIIPCYNAANTLGDCLAGLRDNDLSGVELVVVDDASTDSTSELIESLNSSFELDIRYIRLPERGGPGAARNAGIESSSHPFLFFLDADIILPARSIDFLRETLDLYSHRNRVCGVLGTYAEDTPVKDFFTTFKNLYTCYLYRMTETLSPFIHTPMFAVRKAVLEKEGAFDPTMKRAEDFKLGAILGSKGYRFVIDWRIEGIHLKTYSLSGILREDWHRISELKRIKLTKEQKTFSYRA